MVWVELQASKPPFHDLIVYIPDCVKLTLGRFGVFLQARYVKFWMIKSFISDLPCIVACTIMIRFTNLAMP